MTGTSEDVLACLRGGDLRSLGAANAVARRAAQDPALIPVLINGMFDTDPVLRMRCADALEKANRENHASLDVHAERLLSLLLPYTPKEVLWHILQMSTRPTIPAARRRALAQAVEACLNHSSSIVKTCAMQALAELALAWPSLRPHVLALLRSHSASGTAAMRSRSAKLLRLLLNASPSA